MKNHVVEIQVKSVIPTANGCAVFLGNESKTFVIYVDHFVGSVLQLALAGEKKERPLTHDLIGHILLGLDVKIDRIIINDAREGTFFARLLLRMENELGKKVIEIDARPSDSVVLAVQHKRPIFVTRAVLDTSEDMSELLERLLAQQQEAAEIDPTGDEEGDDDDDLLPGFSDEENDDDEDEPDDDDDDIFGDDEDEKGDGKKKKR